MVEYICEECGKKCVSKYASHVRRFCSHKCANENRWKNHIPKMIVIECQNCGQKFEVKSSDSRLSREGIKYCSKKCMGEASRTGSFIECKYCKKEFYSTRNEFCSPECASKYKVEHYKHKTYFENGYVVEFHNGYNKKGNVKQHRRIMEDFLGRKLSENEVVHHINGDKTDNRIENLQVMTRSEHSSLHRRMEKEARSQI